MTLMLRAVVCWLVLSLPANAASIIEDLYEADVVVSGSGQADLDSPLVGEALRQVLVKMTGQQNFANFPLVNEALDKPRSLVREFGFHSVEINAPEDVRQARGVEKITQRVMRVAFLKGAVLQLIRKSGLPLWSPNRPDILVWLAIDDYQQQTWVTPELSPNIAAKVKDAATARGVPLTFPLADFQDDFALQPAELLQRDFSRVGAASARYAHDLVLAGQAVQTSDGVWIGNWRFIQDGQLSEFDVLGASQEEFLRLGINQVADSLAAKYAVVNKSDHTDISLRVLGLQGFEEYTAIDSYLNSLTSIESADIELIDGELVVFKIDLKGSLEQFENAIMLDKKMVPESQRALTQNFDLQYRWVGDNNE